MAAWPRRGKIVAALAKSMRRCGSRRRRRRRGAAWRVGVANGVSANAHRGAASASAARRHRNRKTAASAWRNGARRLGIAGGVGAARDAHRRRHAVISATAAQRRVSRRLASWRGGGVARAAHQMARSSAAAITRRRQIMAARKSATAWRGTENGGSTNSGASSRNVTACGRRRSRRTKRRQRCGVVASLETRHRAPKIVK